MRNVYLLILFICASGCVVAQKFDIKGQVADSAGVLLSGATVMLLNPTDSALQNFRTTDSKGAFELKNLARKTYLLKITFVGFKTYSKSVAPLTDNPVVDLGSVRLKEAATKLDEVVVEDIIPVVVKKDTIEYNAAAFKTVRNANVEDLLKKLPGVEVDNDGNITAQGETVKRVTVDGKDFFGGTDPKLATKNLPADAIKKVQVHDRKSDQSLFSGIDDGQREKTINLELKEEKRKGAFGNVAAGYGTNDRFQVKASINKFARGKQLSFLGMANNTNDQGFSLDEYMNFTGGSQQMMSGGRGGARIQIGDNQSGVPLNFGNRANGVMKNYAGGLNFNNILNKKTEITGSYFYNHLDHFKIESTDRENFLQNGKYFYDGKSIQDNTNGNHRANVIVDHKIDSLNSLKLTTALSYNETKTDSRTDGQNTDSSGTLLNENTSHSISNGNSVTLNSNLLFRHRFRKKGRTFSTNFQFGLSQATREGFQDSRYSYGTEAGDRLVNQRNTQDTDNLSWGLTSSYTEPLGNRKYLEFNYSVRQNNNDVNRPVYDIKNDESVFNDSLSNIYRSNYTYNRGGLNFRVNRDKFAITFGAGMQSTHLQGDLKIQDVKIDRTYENFLPVARFNYDFSNTQHFRFDYETSVQEPTIQQLQPVLDNRDQLNPYQGNPNLSPAYQQSWRVHFNTFDPGTMINFFLFVDVDYTTNAITNSITTNNFIRTTTPVNVANNMSANSSATFGFPINKLKSRFSVTGTWREQRGVNLIDGQSINIIQRTTGGNIRYNFHYKEVLDINLGAQFSNQFTDYEFNQPDQKFFNTTYNVESILTFLKNYQFNSTLEYLIYENKSTDFRIAIPLVNVAISRSFLKNNNGEIKLAVANLLNRALGVNQSSSVNYIERTTTNSLGRYFMVTFTYTLNKQLNPMSGRPRGAPMMRIIRN
ncbi:MAG: outer membrane beta-barrel protein [Chryseolinea sp.]